MNNLKTILITTVAFIAIAFFSCNKTEFSYNATTAVQPCRDIACSNGGVCQNGNCICPVGFEGVSCEHKWNERYIGTYLTNDFCKPNIQYNTTIVENSLKPDEIILKGVEMSCSNVLLTAKIGYEKTSFNIPLQRSCDSVFIYGKGTHTLDKKFINIYLTKRDSLNHTSTNCSIELRKD